MDGDRGIGSRFGIQEGDLDLAEGDAVPILEGGRLDPAAVEEHPVAALEVLDLIAGSGAPHDGMMPGNARVGEANTVVEFPSDMSLGIDQIELPAVCALVHQQLGHGVLMLKRVGS